MALERVVGQCWHRDSWRARSRASAGLGDGTGLELDGWGQGPHALVLRGTRARWGQEGSLWLAPTHGQCEPSPSDRKAPSASRVSHPSLHPSRMLTPRLAAPTREVLLTLLISLASLHPESQKGFAASPSLWSCRCSGLSCDSSLPAQEGKSRAVSRKAAEVEMAH